MGASGEKFEGFSFRDVYGLEEKRSVKGFRGGLGFRVSGLRLRVSYTMQAPQQLP